jgi:hypothetical protein
VATAHKAPRSYYELGVKPVCLADEERGFIYIENPKVAKTSVLHAMLKAQDRFEIHKDPHIFTWQGYTRSPEEVLASSLPRFTIVRNPYARLVSFWNRHIRGRRKNFSYLWGLSFEDFIKKLAGRQLKMDRHYELQTRILSYRGWPLPTEAIRIENLPEAWKPMEDRFGLPPIPHVHAKHHKDYRLFYVGMTRRYADKLLRKESQLLGYTFDGPISDIVPFIDEDDGQ